MSKVFEELDDWRYYDGEDEVPRDPVSYQIEMTPARIYVEFGSGESLWIEREEGRIRVHAYHPGRDEPVNVEIHKDRIEIDRHDYDQSTPAYERAQSEES